jgi:PAS domain-containing protein
MNGPSDNGADLTPYQLQLEYRALHQFLHLAPVGLVRAQLSGLIVMMNPAAARLLAPLSESGAEFNLFEMLAPITPDLRLLVQQFKRPVGVVCENYRVMLPEPGPGAPAPLALGFTILRLSADPDCLMAVITDQTTAVQLERIQAGWTR